MAIANALDEPPLSWVRGANSADRCGPQDRKRNGGPVEQDTLKRPLCGSRRSLGLARPWARPRESDRGTPESRFRRLRQASCRADRDRRSMTKPRCAIPACPECLATGAHGAGRRPRRQSGRRRRRRGRARARQALRDRVQRPPPHARSAPRAASTGRGWAKVTLHPQSIRQAAVARPIWPVPPTMKACGIFARPRVF